MASDAEKATDPATQKSTQLVPDDTRRGQQQSERVDSQHEDKTYDAHHSSPTSEDVGQSENQKPRPGRTGDGTKAPSKPELIARSQRRGLWGRLSIIAEVANPKDYRNSTKSVMTLIVAMAAATSSTGSAIFYPALTLLADDLNTTPTVVNLSLAFYLLIMAFTPLWWSSWSESVGRRTIYLVSFALFVIFSIVSAVSVNIAMLIVFRIFTGGAAAAVQTVGAGTVADIWEPKQRGRAMGIFFLGPLCGPGIAPIIGGALAQTLGWRSTLWALVIFGAVLFILILFCLPETVARRQSDDEGTAGVSILYQRFIDPLKTLKYLQYPAVIVTVYSGALSFAVLYVILVAIQADFSNQPYNFTNIIVGLLYIPPTLGYAVASHLGGRWIDYLMVRGARRAGRYDADGKPVYLPEDRMQENIWLAASLYPLAMILYGWTVQYRVHWILPCVATFLFGIGSMLMISCVTTMLTEFTPKQSSSGVALNNFVRQILATVAIVVVQPFIDAVGTGWMCTIIGLFAWVTGNLAILTLKQRTESWRLEMNRKLDPQKLYRPN